MDLWTSVDDQDNDYVNLLKGFFNELLFKPINQKFLRKYMKSQHKININQTLTLRDKKPRSASS